MKTRILHVIVASFFLQACGLDVVEFDIVEEGSVGLAGISIPGASGFGSEINTQLTKNDIDPSDIDSLRLLWGTLEMTSQGGLTKDLSFIKDLRFLVSANGMSAAVLASAPGIDSGATSVELQVEGEGELKPYVQAGGMTLEAQARLDPPPPDRVDLRLVFHMRVDVNL
ncbi:MAG: hypothetical protein D6806_17325 [Deltaproteobacteria bacterium]|nr:MAG: hypothetical protein D6806_17325 [Deltaproteobacteria bacterium]